jgi:hypothetical protein
MGPIGAETAEAAARTQFTSQCRARFERSKAAGIFWSVARE